MRGKIKRVNSFVLNIIVGVIIIFSPASTSETEKFPFYLQRLWCRPALTMYPVDVNMDGTDEIFAIYNNSIFSLIDQNINYYHQYPDTLKWDDFKICQIRYFNLFDRKTSSIVIGYCNRDSLFLDIFSVTDTSGFRREKRIYITSGRDLRPPPGWEGSIGEIVLNENRYWKNILVGVNTGYDLKPRGIFSLTPEGKKKWFFETAPHIFHLSIADIDNDGFNEILVSTSSVCNLNRVGNTDDCHSYLYLITDRGKLLWYKEVGGEFSRIQSQMADLDKDGNYEIVLLKKVDRGRTSPMAKPGDKFPPSYLAILDPFTGDILRIVSPGESFYNFVLADINNDLKAEIVTGDKNGILRVFNQKLELIGEYNCSSQIEVKAVTDLNGNGYKEIIVYSWDNSLMIFNHNLELIAKLALEYPVSRLYTVAYGRAKRLLISCSYINNLNLYYLLELRKASIFFTSKGDIQISFIFASIGIIFTLGGILLYLSLRNKVLKALIRENTMDTGVIEVSGKGKIIRMNSTLQNLLNLKHSVRGTVYSTLTETELSKKIAETIGSILDSKEKEKEVVVTINGQDNGIRHFQVKSSKIGNRVVFRVKDITHDIIGRHALSWLPVAQKLGHSIKNHLNLISLPLQRIRKICREINVPGLQKHIDSIEEQVKNLRKLSLNFMKMVNLNSPEIRPVCLNSLLGKMVRQVETGIPAGIEIECFFDNDLPPVPGDEEQLTEAFSNVIQNAIQAVGEEGVIQIETVLSEDIFNYSGEGSEKHARVEVRDSGVGIPNEDMGRIFRPFYTTKPGGSGLGLYIAKQIIEMHNGTIEIKSRKGQMTTVIIKLPICGQDNQKKPDNGGDSGATF